MTFKRTLKGLLGSQSFSVDRGKVGSILRGLRGEEEWRGISRREQSIKDGGGGGGEEWKTNCQRERRGRLE